MSKPSALIQLLDDLKAHNMGTTVVTILKSNATIFQESDESEITLNAEECELLFDSAETVQQLFDALGAPPDASIELTNVRIEDDVADTLNELFCSVEQS